MTDSSCKMHRFSSYKKLCYYSSKLPSDAAPCQNDLGMLAWSIRRCKTCRAARLLVHLSPTESGMCSSSFLTTLLINHQCLDIHRTHRNGVLPEDKSLFWRKIAEESMIQAKKVYMNGCEQIQSRLYGHSSRTWFCPELHVKNHGMHESDVICDWAYWQFVEDWRSFMCGVIE